MTDEEKDPEGTAWNKMSTLAQIAWLLGVYHDDHNQLGPFYRKRTISEPGRPSNNFRSYRESDESVRARKGVCGGYYYRSPEEFLR